MCTDYRHFRNTRKAYLPQHAQHNDNQRNLVLRKTPPLCYNDPMPSTPTAPAPPSASSPAPTHRPRGRKRLPPHLIRQSISVRVRPADEARVRAYVASLYAIPRRA